MPARKTGPKLPKTFEPTPEQRENVRLMSACGAPLHFIALNIVNKQTGKPIDVKGLRRAFVKELVDGLEVAVSRVTKNMYEIATGKGTQAVQAANLFLRFRAGWKPLESVEMTGKDGSQLHQPGQSKVVLYVPDNGRAIKPGDIDGEEIEAPSARH